MKTRCGPVKYMDLGGGKVCEASRLKFAASYNVERNFKTEYVVFHAI